MKLVDSVKVWWKRLLGKQEILATGNGLEAGNGQKYIVLGKCGKGYLVVNEREPSPQKVSYVAEEKIID